MTLIELAERVEAAEGPDRELDAEIYAWKASQREYVIDAYPAPNAKGRIVCFYDTGTHSSPSAPRYTTSIDAAMTLVPRGWIVATRRYFNNDGEYVSAASLTDIFTVGPGCEPDEEVTVSSRIVEPAQGVDPTPLALCAAALRAQGIEAGTGETAKAARPRSGESPVPAGDALKQLQDLGQQFDEADAPAPCGKGGIHDPHP